MLYGHFALEESKIRKFCTGHNLNPRKSVNSCHFYRFLGVFSMKNCARFMGLLFGSTGAHTYPKYGQVVTLPLSPQKWRFLLPVPDQN